MMNRDLLYDFGKLLRKHDPDDIGELVNFLKSKERLAELIRMLESMEEVSRALKKEGKAIKAKNEGSSGSSFKGLSNAILNKSNANKAREDNSE